MRRRLFRISAIRFGEIPSACASWFCDKPYSARNSSLSISPGVTGANSFFLGALLVVVDDPNFISITRIPLENHPPLIVDAYRVEILQVTFELFKAIRRRHP